MNHRTGNSEGIMIGAIYKGVRYSEDDTCDVLCECDSNEPIWVSGYEIARCPNCGRGYRSELIVYQYPPEKDTERDARES